MDVIYDRDSDERYQIDKNDEEIVTNDIEVLKLGNFGLQKNTDNIEKESDERNIETGDIWLAEKYRQY